MYLAAVLQLTCTSDEGRNFTSTQALLERAARAGAQLVVTPEATNFLGPHDEKVRRAEPLTGPTVSRFRELAARHGLHLLLGSVNEASEAPGRCYNTSVLIGPTGDLLGAYRKLHLFDIDLPGEVSFLESRTTCPGDQPVVVPTPLGHLGLSICYDLRFPELYRHLVDAGAEILAVPSAFTLATGKDHWEVLLRARAIENQAWVLAAGQFGDHDDEGLRRSYGHSMIVDPWGQVVGMAADGPNLALAEVDLERLRRIRRSMPVREHRRL